MDRRNFAMWLAGAFFLGFLSAPHFKNVLNIPIYTTSKTKVTEHFSVASLKKDDDLYIINVKNEKYNFSFKCKEDPSSIKDLYLNVDVEYNRNIFFMKNKTINLSDKTCESISLQKTTADLIASFSPFFFDQLDALMKMEEEEQRKKQYSELLKRSI